MFKKMIITFILLIIISIPVLANTSIEYLIDQPIQEENVFDLKTLAMLAKSYNFAGNDTSELEDRLISMSDAQDLIVKCYILLATGDTNLASELAAEQEYNGSWNNDIYSTALISYALLDNNLELGASSIALNYLWSVQKEDGGWGENGVLHIQETALSLLALTKGGYTGETEQKALDWLLCQQGGGSNINTAWVALTLLEKEPNFDELSETIDFLLQSINPDGGWGIYPGQASDPYTSALVVYLLQKYDNILTEVSEGLTYIGSLINDEIWINKAFTYYKVSEISYILRNHPSYPQLKEKYNTYLSTSPEQNNYDYLARKISYFANNGQGQDLSGLIEELLQTQNDDGGWGFDKEYQSDPWDTVLVLRSLYDANYSDLHTYQKVISYFHSIQNTDGSFSIKKGDDGHLYLTTLIVEELTRLDNIIGTGNLISSARNWIIYQWDGFGGFGGSILEDARAFSLTLEFLSSSQVEQTITYLNEEQKDNGSWNNDSLTTAAVLAAFNSLKPDLSVESENISINPEEIYTNDIVNIEVNIENKGYTKANNVEVQLYHGDITEENLAATETVVEILPGEYEILSFEWKAKSASLQTFNIVVDQSSQIEELNENNNLAEIAVNVIPRIDLSIVDEDILITPEDPGPAETLTITARVENRGSLASGEFNISFYNGNPQTGGMVIETVKCSGIEGFGNKEVSIDKQLPEGNYEIYVILDSENMVEEDLEDNNIGKIEIDVLKRVDLAISYRNIFFSNAEPTEGDNILVYANITNKREEAVKNVPVSLYLGNPDKDGILIDTIIIDEIPGNQTKLITWNWDTTGLSDRKLLYVLIDPENIITEVDKSNNEAVSIIYINSRPDLVVNNISANNVVEGQPANIRINIRNQGDVPTVSTTADIELESDSTEKKLLEVEIPIIQANSSYNIDLTVDTVYKTGEYTIGIILDPDDLVNESDENNNKGSRSFSIIPPAEFVIQEEMITFEPGEIYDGDKVKIQSTIKNISSYSDSAIIRISELIEEEWKLLNEEELYISGNNEANIEYLWDSNYKVGSNIFKVEIDPEHVVYEKNKDNNTAEKILMVKEALYPDLMVSQESITTEPDPTARGSLCKLKADIYNLRSVKAEDVLVQFYNGNPENGGVLIDREVVSISGRGNTSVGVDWDTTNLRGYQDIYIIVDPENTIIEHNEDNNNGFNRILLRASEEYIPENLQAMVTYNDVDLSWDSVDRSDIAGYLVYRDGNPLEYEEPIRGSVQASSTYSSYSAERATDGDMNSRWTANYYTYDAWFEEEFDENQYINDLEISWYNRPDEYSIQVWDGEEYIPIIEVTENISAVSLHKLNTSVKRYRISFSKPYRSYVGIYELGLKAARIVTDNSYLDQDLLSGNYSYNVSAINTQGEESLLSEPALANVLPPSAPTGFSAEVEGPDLQLTWNESSTTDLRGYYLMRNGTILADTEELAGTATASGYYSSNYKPEKAVDDNTGTRWYYYDSSPDISDQIWWQYDIGEERYISDINIDWYYIPESFRILIWQGGEWIEIYKVSGNNERYNDIILEENYKTNKIRIALPGGESRYGIREIDINGYILLNEELYLDKLLKAGRYNYQLVAENSLYCESDPVELEIEVEAPEAPHNLNGLLEDNTLSLNWEHQQENGFKGYLVYRNDELINTSDKLNEIATEAKVTVSSVYSTSSSYQASNVINRSSSCWYSGSQQYPAWISLEFEEKKILSEIKLEWYSSYYSAKDYLIQYRDKGIWRTLDTATNNYQTDNIHQFNNPVYTDAIRVYIKTGNYYGYIRLNEIYLYEVEPLKEKNYVDQNLLDGKYNYSVKAVDLADNLSDNSNIFEILVGELPSPENLIATVVENEVFLKWDIDNMDELIGFYIYRYNQLINSPENIVKNAELQAPVYNNAIDNIRDGNESTYWYCYNSQYPAVIDIIPLETDKYIQDIRVVWRDYAASDYNILAMQDGDWITVAEVRGNSDYINEISLEIPVNEVSQWRLEIINGPSRVYLAELEINNLNCIEDNSYINKVLENGIYNYFVRALSKRGKLTAKSNIVQVQVDEKTAPARIEDFNIEERNGSFLLHWTPGQEEDLKGYNIYLSDSDEPVNSDIIVADTSSYSYSQLINGMREYTYSIEAVDNNGNKSIRTETAFKFDRPTAVTELNSIVNKLDITLNWSSSESYNVLGYKLYRNGTLINELNKINPAEITASSFYYQNSNYTASKTNDNNINTYWRPAEDDSNPVIELKFNELQLISAVGTVWHNNTERVEYYTIQAWIDGNWIEILNQDNIIEEITILSEIVVTDRLRMIINNDNQIFGLAEFTAFKAELLGRSYVDRDLSPDTYNYKVVAVNRAGLESDKSRSEGVEITKRDLSISTGDLFFTPYQPSVFDNITLTFKIRNKGTEVINNITAAIYTGNSEDGGTLLTTINIDTLEADGDIIKQYVWNPTGYTGEQTIYVVIDPDNHINEYDETNNIISREITITEYSVLETNVSSIDSSEFPLIKLGVQVNDTLGEGVAGLRRQNFNIKENEKVELITNIESIVDDSSQLALIDLVFVIDTSGSMSEEWDELPQIITELTDTLTKIGIDLNYKVYALNRIYRQVPTVEALTEVIFRGETKSAHQEDWGPGTAWVAKNYNWREDAFRIIIPISDENCYQGSGHNSYDQESIEEATRLCKENSIEAYPFYGTGSNDMVLEEMDYLAAGTGGEKFFFRDAVQVVNYLSRVLSTKKAHYYLEYKTSNQAKDGTLRNITVETSYRDATGIGEGQYRAPQDIYSDLVAVELISDQITSRGQEVLFRGIIENNGGALAENIRVDFYLGDPAAEGIYLDSRIIEELAINEQTEANFNWVSIPGTHDIYMVIDSDNMIEETDESNNIIKLECEVPGIEYPDLFVLDSELKVENNSLFSGERVKIEARVRNTGSESSSIVVGFYEGNPVDGGKLISTVDIDCLPYLAYQDIETYWITGKEPGEKDIYVIVDPLDNIEESNEDNNITIGKVNIIQRDLRGNITTDKPIYKPEEDIIINMSLENHQDITWTGKAKVLIRDSNGNIVEELAEYDINELPGKTEDLPGLWKNYLNWNTGTLSPGTYLLCLQLSVYEDYFAEYVTEFMVLADKTLSANLFSDKATYSPEDNAVFTVNYENTSINTNLESLSLEVEVNDLYEEEIWRDQTVIPYLPMAQIDSSLFYWPVEGVNDGEYIIKAEIKSGETILWSEEIVVTVLQEIILNGRLEIEPDRLKIGDIFELDYTVINKGNADIGDFTLELMLIDDNTEELVKVFNRDHSLVLNESINDKFSGENDLADGHYLVIMQAVNKDKIISLANGGILVDSTPPVTEYELSNKRFERNGVNYGLLDSQLILTAKDNLVGVKDILYTLEKDAGEEEYKKFEEPINFVEEGRYIVRFKAVDFLGNEEIENELDIVIDETAPSIGINLPEGDILPEFELGLLAADNIELDYLELYLDGKKYAEYQVTGSSMEKIVGLQLEPGRYILQARAADKAGYENSTDEIEIEVIDPDTVPPVTTITLEGDKWSDGSYKSNVIVTLDAVDNADGSGVAGIFYYFGKDGNIQKYDGPFTITEEGLNDLYYYAVDNSDNYEIIKNKKIIIYKPWSVGKYTLFTESLHSSGQIRIDNAFSNGKVILNGNCCLDYLGTSQSSIIKQGEIKIGKLELNQTYHKLPEPDWKALEGITTYRDESQIVNNRLLKDVCFENDLSIVGNSRFTGILLVDGDLQIHGQAVFDNVGIFCTGEVTITGNIKIDGFIYSGKGLTIYGQPEISGMMVVNGLARVAGNIKNRENDISRFMQWMKK